MQGIGVLLKNGGRRPAYGHPLPQGEKEREFAEHPIQSKFITR
jgi:hypothetical protein